MNVLRQNTLTQGWINAASVLALTLKYLTPLWLLPLPCLYYGLELELVSHFSALPCLKPSMPLSYWNITFHISAFQTFPTELSVLCIITLLFVYMMHRQRVCFYVMNINFLLKVHVQQMHMVMNYSVWRDGKVQTASSILSLDPVEKKVFFKYN